MHRIRTSLIESYSFENPKKLSLYSLHSKTQYNRIKIDKNQSFLFFPIPFIQFLTNQTEHQGKAKPCSDRLKK